jgi:hypothetical protein
LPGFVHDELSFFQLFFTDIILDTIVDNTNSYADHARVERPSSTRWDKLTRPVLLRYLAFLIYRGVFPSSCIDDYFVKRRDTAEGPDKWKPSHPISEHISHYQVRQLKRYLHISDLKVTAQDPSYYHKVQPLLRHIQKVSRDYYVPKTNVSIDEMIVRFTGRSKHTVRIKGKPTPEGYRILALCDSGYTYAFLPESRVEANIELTIPQQSLSGDLDLNCTSKKVMYMVNHLPLNNLRTFNVYMVNFFSTIALFHNLRLRGVGACGTVRTSTREFPKELKNKNLSMEHGEKGAMVVNDVLALLWVDNGPVTMLTTIHSLHSRECEVEKMRKRPRATGKNKEILKKYGGGPLAKMWIPRAVDDYNHNMGGVDTADQLRQYYTVQMRTRRSWIPLFLWLLDTSIINAYIMWTIHHGAKRTTSHREFRLKLVGELVELSYKLERPQEQLENNATRGNQPENNANRPPFKRSRSASYITTNRKVLDNKRLRPGMHYPVHRAEDNDSDKENQDTHNTLSKITNRIQCEWCRHKSLEGGEKTPHKNRSVWLCVTCKTPLCLTPGRNCFASYNTSKQHE